MYLTNSFDIDFGKDANPGKYIVRIVPYMRMKRT